MPLPDQKMLIPYLIEAHDRDESDWSFPSPLRSNSLVPWNTSVAQKVPTLGKFSNLSTIKTKALSNNRK